MNDTNFLTTMRDSFSEVHASTALELIVQQGRSKRSRRRTRALAMIAAATAVVAAATILVVRPATGPAPGTAQLAAWTVTEQPDGIIDITVRQLDDPAGLQRELHADGIPGYVRFGEYKSGTAISSAGVCPPWQEGSAQNVIQLFRRIFPRQLDSRQNVYLEINPAALPRGAGVGIEVFPHVKVTGPGVRQKTVLLLAVALVRATGYCSLK
jgi:hypothetical protein